MKHGTYTFGLTPIERIIEAFNDEETGGFSWDLRGGDSHNAEALGLFRYNETAESGYLTILEALCDAAIGYGTDESLAGWAFGMRTDMLECIGIEEV